MCVNKKKNYCCHTAQVAVDGGVGEIRNQHAGVGWWKLNSKKTTSWHHSGTAGKMLKKINGLTTQTELTLENLIPRL